MEARDFGSHQYIRSDVFRLNASYFKAIDNSLNLHYASHTSAPTLDQILASSSNLLSRKVTFQNVLNILALYPNCYVIQENHKVNDTSSYSITLPIEVGEFNRSIATRNREFLDAVNLWIEEHPDDQKLPVCEDFLSSSNENGTSTGRNSTSSDSSSRASSPSKITKPSRSLVDKYSLKNTAEKFKFKKKDENVERSKTGLTLLERIKLKELKNKELSKLDNSDTRYANFLNGKLHTVYDILYQMHWSGGRSKVSDIGGDGQDVKKKVGVTTLPFGKFIEIIRDSLAYPISVVEVEDVVVKLGETLGKKVQVLTRGDTTVVRIENLDRVSDLAKIEATLAQKPT